MVSFIRTASGYTPSFEVIIHLFERNDWERQLSGTKLRGDFGRSPGTKSQFAVLFQQSIWNGSKTLAVHLLWFIIGIQNVNNEAMAVIKVLLKNRLWDLLPPDMLHPESHPL